MRRIRDGLTLLLLLGAVAAGSAAPLVSGERLRVGGDGRGPLSAGLSNYPMGVATSTTTVKADLFVTAAKFSHEPGLYLYQAVDRSAEGAPVFGLRIHVAHPGPGDVPPIGTIFQARHGEIYGFWVIDDTVVRTRFDRSAAAFVRLPVPAISLHDVLPAPEQKNPDNRGALRLTVLEEPDGQVEVILSVGDGVPFRPSSPPGYRDPDFQPFNGRGLWRGGWPHVYLRAGRLPAIEAPVDALTEVRDISTTRKEALLSHGLLTIADLGPGREQDLVTGSHFGNFYHYANATAGSLALGAAELVRDAAGRVLRSPLIAASPLAYPNPKDGRTSDLVVGGEGALFYLRRVPTPAGQPLAYADPVPVWEEQALLFAGSLPVVNAVDWDGDGDSDLVAGNSEGQILLFTNHGTEDEPDFSPGQPLEAGGEVIQIEGGYWGIQGPGESRWGYVSPTVTDWNGDGLPDLLMSGATARHTLYLNTGTRTEPRLAAPRPLYSEGIDLHGTWRVRPAAARWGEGMAYVMLDDDDEFHAYGRIDDQNLADRGKLRLEDGSAIRANFLDAGGTGRSKITLFDWDGDGAIDLLVGTPRHGSVPNPTEGLPQAKGLPGSTVLWLRNTGTDAAPRFAFPQILHVKGKPVYLGQHECSVAVTTLGGPGGPNLLVGDEEGRIHFFHHRDISWSR